MLVAVVAQQVGGNPVMFPATILFILHWLLQIFGQISDHKIHFQYISKLTIVAKKINNGPTTKEKIQVRVQKVEEKNRLGGSALNTSNPFCHCT